MHTDIDLASTKEEASQMFAQTFTLGVIKKIFGCFFAALFIAIVIFMVSKCEFAGIEVISFIS